jgi:hypothetical protein
MSTHSDAHEGLEGQVKVYDGDRLLTAATGTLWLDDDPRHGVMAVPGNQNWLRFPHLTLETEAGTRYSILPTRVEHAAGAGQMLLFDIE